MGSQSQGRDASSSESATTSTDVGHVSMEDGDGTRAEKRHDDPHSPASPSPTNDDARSRGSSPLSELSLSDDDGNGLDELRSSSDDNESPASEFDSRVTKKAKGSKGEVTKKTKKKPTKKKRKSPKGKGKAKQVPDEDEESDTEVHVRPKGLIAKRPEWQDIPCWTDDRCPIFSLGVELLDRCFDISQGLGCREYIALAGTSRFFRHHLDDDFFHALYHQNKSACPKTDPPLRCNDKRPLYSPFSRTLKEVYAVMPLKAPVDLGKPKHYRPRGERTQWTKSQYTVYKEEKTHWIEKTRQRLEMDEELRDLQDESKENELGVASLGYYRRTVLAVIPGRLHGQPAVQKDDRGLPILHPSYDLDLLHFYTVGEGNDTDYSESGEDFKADDGTLSESGSSMDAEPHSQDGDAAGTWTVPETDDEDSEAELLPATSYNALGRKIIHDFWPSKFRREVAIEVNDAKMTKTAAMSHWKVTEAELITLKHVLVANPRNSRSPQQLFSKAAVEWLALRAHGGQAGHKAHVAQLDVRAKKARETRKKNGTLRKKKRGCSCPGANGYQDHSWWCEEQFRTCDCSFCCPIGSDGDSDF